MKDFLSKVLINKPEDWLSLTTHRLDIYNEELAKTEFLNQFEKLFECNDSSLDSLSKLPTAYDYIRLGHPLSCVLEWAIAKQSELSAQQVISFSSQVTPILAVLRTNLLINKKTKIVYTDELPKGFDIEVIKKVYGYKFVVEKVEKESEIAPFDGSTIYLSYDKEINFSRKSGIDFHVQLYPSFGSIMVIYGMENNEYISAIQHVRRRETIAMTPINCESVLKSLIGQSHPVEKSSNYSSNKNIVVETIKEITGTSSLPLVGSSGLSIQYAIMMGLIQDGMDKYSNKEIKFIVPPNCYGGTNDQARRVAACLDRVEILDLPVDGDNDMVKSINKVLDQVAKQDAIPYIIAEIPTNPRVEVPNLEALKAALSKERRTPTGSLAVSPVFILDQTFCPNVQFLKQGGLLAEVPTISYASGSKFPSGGKCTAGYCVGNAMMETVMNKIGNHLSLCDNQATAQQMQILAEQMPSMNQRIAQAYRNTRSFVDFIQDQLPEAKINFVSSELADLGFTPSVFSLDLPTKGATEEEREMHKRTLNHKLINMMITQIPTESKYCVSYGQLKGCYWTIPATSTQGTTKEGDKDYIARVAVSPLLDLDKHKTVFRQFVLEID